MATPRSLLVDSEIPLHYHIVSRCVRRSWLCGLDKRTGKNFDHRKQWLKERLFRLVRYFAVSVEAFTIMSSHFHLVVFFDPKAASTWSDEELVDRWLGAFPPKCKGPEDLVAKCDLLKERFLSDPVKLDAMRRCLGSLSGFMKHLKQPVARRANQEDGCSGHFFEGRYYSGALLNENAVVAAMAYVDLNPVRAKIVHHLEECIDSSIVQRLESIANSVEKLQQALTPLVSGLDDKVSRLGVTLETYIGYLESLVLLQQEQLRSDSLTMWYVGVASFRKRMRAYGTRGDLQEWFARRGWKRCGKPLPWLQFHMQS